MSAWIVTKKHIDVLMSYAVNVSLKFEFNETEFIVSKDNADIIGYRIWQENYRSVNARYHENNETPIYRYDYVGMDPNTILKQLHCYDYQACECDDYDITFARAFVRAMKDSLEANGASDISEEYGAAPWGID